jgi:hypothetical protein
MDLSKRSVSVCRIINKWPCLKSVFATEMLTARDVSLRTAFCDRWSFVDFGELENGYDDRVIEIIKTIVGKATANYRRLAGPLKQNLRRDVYNIFAWSVFGPFLAIWPMVSALPAVSLFVGQGTAVQMASQVLLLATGFWGLGGGAIALWYTTNVEARSSFRSSPRKLGLPLAVYASAWTGVYAWMSYVR